MSFDIKLLQCVHCLFSILCRILFLASAKALRGFCMCGNRVLSTYHVRVGFLKT